MKWIQCQFLQMSSAWNLCVLCVPTLCLKMLGLFLVSLENWEKSENNGPVIGLSKSNSCFPCTEDGFQVTKVPPGKFYLSTLTFGLYKQLSEETVKWTANRGKLNLCRGRKNFLLLS